MKLTETADLVIEGIVVTMADDRRVIRDGAVAVQGDRIVAVDDAGAIRERYEAKRTMGGKRRIVIPGLIDCHNHLAQPLVREYALEDYPNIYRVYIPCEMAMDPDDAAVSARFGIAQLLRAGVTTVAETTCTAEHEEPIARTVMETGIRCAMARGIGDRGSRPTTIRSTASRATATTPASCARTSRSRASGSSSGRSRARAGYALTSTTSACPRARTIASSPPGSSPPSTTRR
jgi:5-methylthioadenosine/S-adenosylhomocysteine deaminase